MSPCKDLVSAINCHRGHGRKAQGWIGDYANGRTQSVDSQMEMETGKRDFFQPHRVE
ncbi:hypothetical protein J6590_034268 [Homalodisca vitripennis]|nr:hypothetical protein J6590_034268 [Homalodisca vitripennis]